MTSFLERLDANIIGEISKFLTIKEKLLPFLSLSSSISDLFSSTAFKHDDLLLNNKMIACIDRYGLSSWNGRLFSSLRLDVDIQQNPAILLKLNRIIKYFPSKSLNSFKFKSWQLPDSTSELLSLLKSPSLTNIKIIELRIISIIYTPGLSAKDFKSLKFPQLKSLTIRFNVGQAIKARLPISNFLLRHATIHSLVVDFHVMNENDWNELFLDPLMLPNLNKLSFIAVNDVRKDYKDPFVNADYKTTIEALGSTIIPATNKPRPLEFLSLKNTDGDAVLFHSLSLIPTLINTEITILSRDFPLSYGQLSPPSAIKSLTSLNFDFAQCFMEEHDEKFKKPPVSEKQITEFFQALSYSSLTILKLNLPMKAGEISLGSDTMKYFVQLTNLKKLDLTVKLWNNYIDWSNSSMFLSCHFSSLLTMKLEGFQLSRESFALIAAASPNVTEFTFEGKLGFHAAILCLIIGCHWLKIQSVESDDKDWKYDFLGPWRRYHRFEEYECFHQWQKLTVEEFEAAKQLFPQHPQSFEQLQFIKITVCSCITSIIWFQLFQLFEHAKLIHCVDGFHKYYITDPTWLVGVMGLSLLPSLKSISSNYEISGSESESEISSQKLPKHFLTVYRRRLDNSLENESVYTVLRPKCDKKIPQLNGEEERFLTLSTKVPHYELYQFIEHEVGNGMTGRQAFFNEIFHLLSEVDQVTVQKLLGEKNEFVNATAHKDKKQKLCIKMLQYSDCEIK